MGGRADWPRRARARRGQAPDARLEITASCDDGAVHVLLAHDETLVITLRTDFNDSHPANL